MEDMSLAESVRAARHESGWSQETLASRASVNKETIMRIEQGEDTRRSTIAKIRKVLPGVDRQPPRDLLTLTEKANMEVSALAERMATRIGNLTRGIGSVERLHAVRNFVLQQLQDEQMDEESEIRSHSAASAAFESRQESAERRLVKGARGHKGNKRRPNGGDGRFDS